MEIDVELVNKIGKLLDEYGGLTDDIEKTKEVYTVMTDLMLLKIRNGVA